MDSVISQLRNDFYAHIRAFQAPTLPQVTSTLAVLTDEEIQELETAWIEFSVWKRRQAH
nr:hypothetical protein [uncultured Vibrio sp.]